MLLLAILLSALSQFTIATLAADCSQPFPSGDPSPGDLASFLTPLISGICSPQVNTTTTTPKQGYVFYVESTKTSLNVAECISGFTDIVEQCVTNGTACPGASHCFGGQWTLDGQLFNLTNAATGGWNPITAGGGGGGPGGGGIIIPPPSVLPPPVPRKSKPSQNLGTKTLAEGGKPAEAAQESKPNRKSVSKPL